MCFWQQLTFYSLWSIKCDINYSVMQWQQTLHNKPLNVKMDNNSKILNHVMWLISQFCFVCSDTCSCIDTVLTVRTHYSAHFYWIFLHVAVQSDLNTLKNETNVWTFHHWNILPILSSWFLDVNTSGLIYWQLPIQIARVVSPVLFDFIKGWAKGVAVPAVQPDCWQLALTNWCRWECARPRSP